MPITSHSQSTSLANVNGKMGSTQTVKEAWSGIHTGPIPIKSLVLGCINGLKKGAKLQIWAFINELIGRVITDNNTTMYI